MRFLIAATLFVASPVLAAETLPLIPEGTGYGAAREMMLRAGYKPVAHEDSARCSSMSSVCTTYPEVSTCTSASVCRFEWTRSGITTAAIVEARGESAQSLSVVKTIEAPTGTPYPLGTTQ